MCTTCTGIIERGGCGLDTNKAHKMQPSALGLETTSEFNNSHSMRVWTMP